MSVWTVSRELGHESTALVERTYGHLGKIRHRSEVVEYRVENHVDRIRDQGRTPDMDNRLEGFFNSMEPKDGLAKVWEELVGRVEGIERLEILERFAALQEAIEPA